ncbi:MAG TPA: glycosyltransferase [Acidobacteriaceae bacterium]
MARRILHLIASNFIGGPEKQILHHALDLQGPEYEIAVGSFRDQPQSPEILREAERHGLETFCLSGGLRLRPIAELTAVLRRSESDLLCTHGYKANVVGHFAAQPAGVAHVPIVRGWTAETWQVSLYERLERHILARSHWVGCVSARQARELADARGKRSAPFVIRNAMLPQLAQTVKSWPVTRVGLKIPPLAFVFGAVGRLSVEKGHRFLIDAFRQVSMAYAGPRTPHLILLGAGREQAALQEQARGLESRVHFAGFRENPADWMRLFDCMVLPSLTEGTPNAVLEAMSMQIPTIASSVGGVPDLIADERNGLLVAPGDSSALAAAMNRVLRTPQLCRQLMEGTAGVSEEYSPAAQRERFLAMYAMVLSEQAVRRPATDAEKCATMPASPQPLSEPIQSSKAA